MVSAFSVPKASREQKTNSNPGPGNYNPQASPIILKKSDPLYSFGKEQRKYDIKPVPGPGSYQQRGSIIEESKPSYSMVGRKEPKTDTNRVGPGHYQSIANLFKQKSPAYSMFGRGKSLNDNWKPGPGNYEVKGELDIGKKHGVRFGKDSRDTTDKRSVPGPGSYEYEGAVLKYGSKQDPSYGFGSKLQGPTTMNVPGPGSYSGKFELYSKIGGIVSRDLRSFQDKSFTPGPGNYNNDGTGTMNRNPSWSMSKSSKNIISKQIPLGPGQYEHDKNYKSVIMSSPGYQFGGDRRLMHDTNAVPGPGSYNDQPLKSHRGIKMGEKSKDLLSNHVPGPGSYESGKYDNDSWVRGRGRYSLGKSVRDLELNKLTPGPGTYESNLDHPKKGKVAFSKDSKLKHSASGVPGPGQYDLKPTFADVPKYLLPAKV